MSDKSIYELIVNGEVYTQPVVTDKLYEGLKQLALSAEFPGYLLWPKKTQKEINAEWRPWWNRLTPVEIEVIAGRSGAYFWTSMGAEVLSVDENNNPTSISFPNNCDERLWVMFKNYIAQPNNFLPPLLRRIPGMNKSAEFPCHGKEHPCSCGCGVLTLCEEQTNYIYNVIMHLNDLHRWSYEQIADWLDTLGVDFSFPMPDTITGP